MATKNENSAAAALLEAHGKPSDDRGARARHAGNERQHLTRRQRRGRAAAACRSASTTRGAGRSRSTSSMTSAADDERNRKHAGALVEDRLDVIGEERSGEERRNRGDDNRGGEMPGLRRCSRASHAMPNNLDAIQPDDREDRSELDHHGEDSAGIVVADGLAEEQQMRGGRDRKKLRDSLHDSEQRRS